MNRKMFGMTVVVAVLLGGAIQPVGAASQKADINLEADDGKTTPDVPIKETTPDGKTGETGPLRIVNLTPFNFGNQKLSGKTAEYKLDAVIYTAGANIQVTDNRGTGEGWQLKVTGADFSDGTNTLKGAELTIPKGKVESDAGNVSADAESFGVTVNTNAATVMSAKVDAGMGNWLNDLPLDGIVLKVPGGNKAGKYASTLTWTLEATPAP